MRIRSGIAFTVCFKHIEATPPPTISTQERGGSFPYKELNPSLFFELSFHMIRVREGQMTAELLPLFPAQLQTPGSSKFLGKVKRQQPASPREDSGSHG